MNQADPTKHHHILITHDSLVGGTCGILAKEAWDDCQIYTHSFNSSVLRHLGLIELLKRQATDNPYLEMVVVAGLPLHNNVLKYIDDYVPQEKIDFPLIGRI